MVVEAGIFYCSVVFEIAVGWKVTTKPPDGFASRKIRTSGARFEIVSCTMSVSLSCFVGSRVTSAV